MNVEASLADAEARHAKAIADAAARRNEFESDPSEQSHAAMVVAEQLARNAVVPVEAARAALESTLHAEIETKLVEARGRASASALFERIAPARARLVAFFGQALKTIAEIQHELDEQHDGAADAAELARQLGVHADSDDPVPLTLVRATVGVALAEQVVASDARFPVGQEPWRFLEPQWDRNTHDSDQIRRAIEIALPPDTFLPSTADFHADLADVAPWNEEPDQRPQRWEV